MAELIVLIKQVDQLPICTGIRNHNLIKVIESAYRCGNAWVAMDCEQTLETNTICKNCFKLRPELRKRAESTLKRVKKPINKIVKYQTKNKVLSRQMQRIKHRVNNLRASLKIIQRKFLNLEDTTLENAIQNEDNLPAQMKMGLVTAAHVAKAKSKHGVRLE